MNFSLKARRQLWLKIHLYLGLFGGALLSVVALTGSVLVFYEELQEILNAEQIVVTAPPQHHLHSLDEMVAVADKTKPAQARFFKVYYPRNTEVAYKLLYFTPPPADAESGDGYYIFVNPYTAQVTGQQLWHPHDRYWGRPLISLIMQLHYCLLLDDGGVIFVGILAALMIISVLTGMIVWWPLTGKFKQALRFKAHSSAVRFNFDLHKIIGIYLGPVLLAVLFSGVYFNLPEQVNLLAKQVSSLRRPNAWEGLDSTKLQSQPANGHKTVSYTEVEQRVNQQYPSGKLWMLEAPHDAQGVYRIAKRDAPELSAVALGYRDFAVDQYSGEILQVYQAGTGSAADIFLDWQWPLHSGQAFGWTGRILVFLSGLACPVLFVTGVIRWQQKRRAKKHVTLSTRP